METTWFQLLLRTFCFTFTLLGLFSLEISHIVHCSTELASLSSLKYYSFKTHKNTDTESSKQFRREVNELLEVSQHSHGERDLFAGDKSRALDYVANIYQNKTLHYQDCLNVTYVSLQRFNIKYSKKSFEREFGIAANHAITIANSLTNLFFNHEDVEINKINDKEMPPLTSLLRYTVEKTPSIISSGIFFEKTGFFPYVKKDHAGTSVSNMGTVMGFISADFYRVPMNKNYSYLWKSERVSKDNRNVTYIGQSEGYWTDPYFDCANLDKWIVTYSAPFFYLVKGKPEFG